MEQSEALGVAMRDLRAGEEIEVNINSDGSMRSSAIDFSLFNNRLISLPYSYSTGKDNENPDNDTENAQGRGDGVKDNGSTCKLKDDG